MLGHQTTACNKKSSLLNGPTPRISTSHGKEIAMDTSGVAATYSKAATGASQTKNL